MGVCKPAVGFAFLASLVVVLFGAASPGGAASPAVTFSLSCSPPTVTPGDDWGCTGTIANAGPQTATHVTLVEQIPGATLTFSSFGVPATCTSLTGGGTSCSLGNLKGEQSIIFTTVFGISSSSTGTLSNLAYVTFDEGGSDTDKSKQDTVCANTNTSRPCDPLQSTQLVAGGNLDLAGGYLAFAGDDTLATAAALTATSNVSTNAQVPFRGGDFPVGFGATIVERSESFAGELCPSGFTCFGQIAVESFLGDFSTSDPLVLTYQLIVPKGKNANNLLVFHNGQGPAQFCSVAPLSVMNEFCVQSITQNPKTKVMTVVVLQTENGSGRFG